MKELAAVSHLFLSYTAHFWTSCLVMRNRLVHCWLHNPSRSAEVSASWSGPVFRAALSPFLPDDLALPLSSLTRSHSPVRHCPPRCKAASPLRRGSFIPPPPGFLEAHTAIASSLLQPWCPFHLLSSRLFFFPIDYYIISPSSQSCHNSSQDLLSSECWSHKWHLGKSIQTPLRFPEEPLSIPPFACLSCLHHPVPPCLPNSSSSKSERGHIFLQDFLTTFPLQAASFVSFVVSTIHISDDTCNLTEL